MGFWGGASYPIGVCGTAEGWTAVKCCCPPRIPSWWATGCPWIQKAACSDQLLSEQHQHSWNHLISQWLGVPSLVWHRYRPCQMNCWFFARMYHSPTFSQHLRRLQKTLLQKLCPLIQWYYLPRSRQSPSRCPYPWLHLHNPPLHSVRFQASAAQTPSVPASYDPPSSSSPLRFPRLVDLSRRSIFVPGHQPRQRSPYQNWTVPPDQKILLLCWWLRYQPRFQAKGINKNNLSPWHYQDIILFKTIKIKKIAKQVLGQKYFCVYLMLIWLRIWLTVMINWQILILFNPKSRYCKTNSGNLIGKFMPFDWQAGQVIVPDKYLPHLHGLWSLLGTPWAPPLRRSTSALNSPPRFLKNTKLTKYIFISSLRSSRCWICC